MRFVVLAAVRVRYDHHRKLADPCYCVLYSSRCFVCSRITFYVSSLYNSKASRPLNSSTYSVRKFADYESADISEDEVSLTPFFSRPEPIVRYKIIEGKLSPHEDTSPNTVNVFPIRGRKNTIMDEHN